MLHDLLVYIRRRIYRFWLRMKFTDPRADVILITDDGARLRVESYYLMACSSFFRSLLLDARPAWTIAKYGTIDIPPTPSQLEANDPIGFSAPKEIELGGTTELDLTLLLEFIRRTDRPPAETWEHYARALDLARKYGCDLVYERIILALIDHAATSPWKMFCVASHHQRIDLARAALLVMGEDPSCHLLRPGAITFSLAVHCDLPYLLGLQKTLVSGVGNLSSGWDWKKIAAAFSPVI